MNYGIFNRPIVTIYEAEQVTKQTPEGALSTIADEGLYGNTCRVLAGPGGYDRNGNPLSDEMVEIVTSYGYFGFVKKEELVFAREAKLRSWLHGKFALVSRVADVLSVPKSMGAKLITLSRGSTVEVLPERASDAQGGSAPIHVDGWQRVRLVDERVGYIRETSLKAKLASRSAVLYLDGTRSFNEAVAMARGIAAESVVQYTVDKFFSGDEALLREKLVETALTYLGTEYRWGGKTTDGIDCSGLVSAAYMQNGLLIYRDARIVDGWPVKEIDRANIQAGDLLYFPGHVAMYIGKGRYVHATGAATSGGVVINSLVPGDPLYRQDLFDAITACGSVF